MDRDQESIYLLDMSTCRPHDAISRSFEEGKWIACDYSIRHGEGKMLFSSPDSQVPAIRLDPGVKGWHHIFVGTFRHRVYPNNCLLLKLKSDPGYTRAIQEDFRYGKDLVSKDMIPGETDICEAFWKSADLSGQEIVFHRPSAGAIAESVTNIAYIRLVPLSSSERDRAERDLIRTDTRLLIANYDSNQHTMWAYASDQDLVDEFQALAQSDFKMVLWGCAAAFATFYPSRVCSEIRWTFGAIPPGGWGGGAFGRTRGGTQTVSRYTQNGFDPLKAAVRRAHEIGIEIYPQVRMVGEQLPPNHRDWAGPGDFQEQHSEYRSLTPDGHPTRHLSHAFPDVRAKYVDLFREWVEEYEADGVNIIFCRCWPYVFYEDPVVESFRAAFGIDMRKLDPFDQRVLQHRSGFLTQLLRETRKMLDDVGVRRGKRLGTCYVVPADRVATGCPDLGPFTGPLSHAMDVETWVKEGLVDHLIVHIEGVGKPDAGDRASLIRPYVDLAQGTKVQVYADLYPRRQSADSMRTRAMVCYEAGVDGLCFWDSMIRAPRLSGWAMHRLLGHKQELDKMKPFAEDIFRLEPMITFDTFSTQDEYCLPTDG